MKNYLTIGDLAKLKGISVKALRYYEKIGILKPDYINPANKYRYYHPKQLIKIDFILSFLELNIPLKNFYNYINNDTLDFNRLLTDSNILIEQELHKLQIIQQKIKNMSLHLSYSVTNPVNTEYHKLFSQRFLLITPVKKPHFLKQEYIRQVSNLYRIIEQKNYIPLYQSGLLSIAEGEDNKLYVFAEISGPQQYEPMVINIPAGNYSCKIYKQDELDTKQILSDSKSNCTLLIERWTPYTNEKNILIEVQMLEKQKG